MNPIKIRPILLKYHRNGVCGIGFYALNFEWNNVQSGESGKNFIGTFEVDSEDQHLMIESCRILNTKNITSSYRGDEFADAIQKKLAELGNKYSKPMIYDLIKVVNKKENHNI